MASFVGTSTAPTAARRVQQQPFVALGVLSAAITFETNRAKADRSRLLRQRVRDAARTGGPNSGVAMRFVLAHPAAERAPKYAADYNAALREAELHGDMVFLNQTENFYLCSYKFRLWYQHALISFPTARFFAIADPDTFIQHRNFEADLRTVQALVDTGQASQHVQWGLVIWKAYFNRVSMEPAPDFAGWSYNDHMARGCRSEAAATATSLHF